MSISHEDAKASPICHGCGNAKEKELIVCWSCYQHRQDVTPFKHFDGSLEDWLKMVKNLEPNLRNRRLIKFYRAGAVEVVADAGDRAILRQLTGRGTVNGPVKELLRDLTGGFIFWQEVEQP